MSLLNELVFGKGYIITKIPNLELFSNLKDEFIKKINLETKDILSLRKKIALFNKNEINDLMVKMLLFNEASEMMINSCKELVEEICGRDLFIQRRANTIFNLPGKDQRRQWPHYELMSGISPYSFVIWAPFHDLDNEGGVYYVDQKASLELIKKEEENGLVNSPMILDMMYNYKPAQLKYGEVIIFNPFILHGNISFESDKARIACSVRFQSQKKPLMQKNTDFFKSYTLQ